jgi:hypothetical protein
LKVSASPASLLTLVHPSLDHIEEMHLPLWNIQAGVRSKQDDALQTAAGRMKKS